MERGPVSGAQSYPGEYPLLRTYAFSQWAVGAGGRALASAAVESQAAAVPIDAARDAQAREEPEQHERSVGPDLTLPVELLDDEVVLAGPVAATFTPVAGDGTTASPKVGQMYLTDRRLLVTGQLERAIDLRRITELGLTLGRLLVTITRSRGLMIDVEGAEALRTRIAHAVSARRSGGDSELVPVMASGLGAVSHAELVEDVADVPAHGSG